MLLPLKCGELLLECRVATAAITVDDVSACRLDWPSWCVVRILFLLANYSRLFLPNLQFSSQMSSVNILFPDDTSSSASLFAVHAKCVD